MYLLNAQKLKYKYFDSDNFKLLHEIEINVRDDNNNTVLMFLCSNN